MLNKEKKLLILDLDETLVHAAENDLNYPHDFEAGHYLVYLRPYVNEFIQFCFEHFKVAVWTSSGSDYADIVVKAIFGSDEALEFVWSRKRCTQRFDHSLWEYYFIKDLKKVKRRGFDLKQVIMVDNTPRKLMRHYGNLLRVTNFEGDQRDEELLDLMTYLEEIKQAENIRTIEKRSWKSRLKSV